MRSLPVVLQLLIAAALLALPATAGAAGPAADTPIVGLTTPTYVSSYGGMAAWSQYDAGVGGYQLVLRSKGKTTVPKINNRPSPFDVTMGPDEHNRPVALYSRCVKVTDYNVNEITSSVECDAYKYDPHKKKETKLSSLSQEGIAEQWPAQWKRNYVVSRVLYNGNKGDEQDRCDGIYVRPIKQASGIKTIPLSKGVCGVVNGIAFRGKTVGYTVLVPGNGSQTSQLRVTSINTNKSSTKLASQTFTGTADGYLSPVLDSSYAYASRGGKATTSKWVRVQLSNKKTTQLEAGNVLAGSIARDNGTTTYVEV